MKFCPEPKSKLADRLPDALIDDHEMDGWSISGCKSRENTFDFDDNMRLEIVRSGEEFHVIASPAGGPVFRRATPDDVLKSVIERTKEIGLIDIIGQSDITVVADDQNLHLVFQKGTGMVTKQWNQHPTTAYGAD